MVALKPALLASVASAATLAQLIQQNPLLTKVAATVAQHPEWTQPGNWTVFAPSDPAVNIANYLKAPDVGVFQTLDPVDLASVYNVIPQADKKKVIVLTADAGVKAVRHLYGLGPIVDPVIADNGRLVVMQVAIGEVAAPSLTLPALGCNTFLAALTDAGLKNIVDGLSLMTMFCPNDAAMAAAQPALSKLSKSQLKATLLYHIVPQVIYSSLMNNAELPTLLQGNTINVKATANGVDVGNTGRTIFDLADTATTNGVIHRLAFVIAVPALPNGDVVPFGIPPGSVEVAVTGTPIVPVGSAPDAGTTPPAKKNSVLAQGVSWGLGAIGSLLAFVL